MSFNPDAVLFELIGHGPDSELETQICSLTTPLQLLPPSILHQAVCPSSLTRVQIPTSVENSNEKTSDMSTPNLNMRRIEQADAAEDKR
ncbi:hypothetical protein L3X38_002551 [Prunus dulcis]|uniref:Uncharacterized protein n=1 Tax=Prunus dulcis TaxID=3755 RepID=A0AAD4WX58_PRUDU|nr:hypothetical protein L3X38_002551 [Prunus dulcis]